MLRVGVVSFRFEDKYCGPCNQRGNGSERWDKGNTRSCRRFFTKVDRAFLKDDETAWLRCSECIKTYGGANA